MSILPSTKIETLHDLICSLYMINRYRNDEELQEYMKNSVREFCEKHGIIINKEL